MPLVYVFAASKMEAQPVLATAGVSSQESGVRNPAASRHAGTASVAAATEGCGPKFHARERMLRWQLRERVAVPPLAGRLGAAGCRTDSGVAFPAT